MDYLHEQGYIVIGADLCLPADLELLPAQLVKLDYRRFELTTKYLAEADVVVHLAANTVPSDGINLKGEIAENVIPCLDLIEECIKNRVKKFVFASSASVYGASREIPLKESSGTNPISYHGVQKLMLEKALQVEKYAGLINVKIARLSNPFGRHQNINGRQGFVAMLLGAIKYDREIQLYGGGRHVRDYIAVDNVCRGLESLLADDSDEAVYNFGSGRGWSQLEIVRVVEDVTGKRIKYRLAEGRRGDIPTSVLDISKAERVLRYSGDFDLAQTIRGMATAEGIC